MNNWIFFLIVWSAAQSLIIAFLVWLRWEDNKQRDAEHLDTNTNFAALHQMMYSDFVKKVDVAPDKFFPVYLADVKGEG